MSSSVLKNEKLFNADGPLMDAAMKLGSNPEMLEMYFRHVLSNVNIGLRQRTEIARLFFTYFHKPDESLRLAKQILEREPQYSPGHVLMGELYEMCMNDLIRAEEHYTLAAEYDKADPWPQYRLGSLYSKRLKHFEQAHIRFEHVFLAGAADMPTEFFLDVGLLEYYYRWNIDNARRRLEEAVRLTKLDVDAHFYLARLLVDETDEIQAAIDVCDQAMARFPQSVSCVILKAEILLHRHPKMQADTAEELLRRAQTIIQSSSTAVQRGTAVYSRMLGRIAAIRGVSPDFDRHYQRAVDLDDKDEGLNYEFGYWLEHHRQYDKALEQFELCLQLNPKHLMAILRASQVFGGESELGERGRTINQKASAKDCTSKGNVVLFG